MTAPVVMPAAVVVTAAVAVSAALVVVAVAGRAGHGENDEAGLEVAGGDASVLSGRLSA